MSNRLDRIAWRRHWTLAGALLGLAVANAGCAGAARVELAAADVIEQAADRLASSLAEYHEDVAAADAARGDAAATAFVARVSAAQSEGVSTQNDVDAFLEAMRRLRLDRETAWRRYSVSLENVDVLREVSEGLRRLALESMSLDDEARRYLGDVVDAWRRAKRGGLFSGDE